MTDESATSTAPERGRLGWLVRYWGLCTVACRRIVARGTQTDPRRIWLTVTGVAVAIALLLVVSGLAIGIAAPTAGSDESVDYWIVPESDSVNSPVAATGGTTFGDAHVTNERIMELDGVRHSTPLLTTVLRMESATTSEFVMVVGILPETAGETVLGLPTAELSGGTTNGAVLSEGAASVLTAAPGDELTMQSDEQLTVVDVAADADDITGTAPIVLVNLSLLQTSTGADQHDQADMFLVESSSAAVPALEAQYPNADVLTDTELLAAELIDSELALALGFTAMVIAIGIGTMVVVTTMGLEVAADRAQLATLAAMGFSGRSRLGVYAVQTLILSALGGILGGIGGIGGIALANAIADAWLSAGPVAIAHPLMIVYGVAVALIIGLITIPALAVTMRRLESGGGPTYG